MSIKLVVNSRSPHTCAKRDMVSEAIELGIFKDSLFDDIGHIAEIDTVVDNLIMVSEAITTTKDAKTAMEHLGVLDQCYELLNVSADKLSNEAALEGLGQRIINGIARFFRMIMDFIKKILHGIRRMFMSADERKRDDAERINHVVAEVLVKMSNKKRTPAPVEAKWFKEVRAAVAANTSIGADIGILTDKIINASSEADLDAVNTKVNNLIRSKKKFFETVCNPPIDTSIDLADSEPIADFSKMHGRIMSHRHPEAQSCKDAGYADIKDMYQTYKVIHTNASEIVKVVERELQNASKILERKFGAKLGATREIEDLLLDMREAYSRSDPNVGDTEIQKMLHRACKMCFGIVRSLSDITSCMSSLINATSIWDDLNAEIDRESASAAKSL